MNRDLWRVSFGNELAKQERKQASKFRAYLKQNYDTAIDQAVERQGMQPLDGLFKETELKDLYIDLYRTIGTRFALWYEDAYKKLIKKNGDRTTWAETFAGVGEREAGRKIVIVQGTAKKEVQRVLGRLFKDPDFTAQGAEVQGRILKQQFNQISQYQAERIVRTETTNAANQGVMKSATDLFGKDNLQKEWIASLDERTRGSHAAVNGDTLGYNRPFRVMTKKGGVDLMQHPADPAGSAENVINCRCSIALIPKADAELQEGVELEGFGGALAARTSRLIGDELVTAAKPTKEVVEEAVEYEFKPSNWDDFVTGHDVNDGYLAYLKKPIAIRESPVTYSRRYGREIEQGSYYNGRERVVQIAVKRHSETRGSILAHELGHALNDDLGLMNWNYVDPRIKESFIKVQKMFGVADPDDIKLNAKLKALRNKYGGGKTAKLNHKNYFLYYEKYRDEVVMKDFPELTVKQVKEYTGAIADTLASATDCNVGWGHEWSDYFKFKYLQYEEYMAHAYENYFAGNPVFKKYFPEVYKEMTDLVENILKTSKYDIETLRRIFKAISRS